MSKVTILSFGSGSTGNSMFIQMDDVSFMVDLGVRYKNVQNHLSTINKTLDDIQMVFLTHSHYDHTLGFPVLKKHMNPQYFASKRTRDNMGSKLFTGLDFDEVHELKEGFRVQLLKTSHDCSGSCGFVFEYHGTKLGYVTDLGYMSDEIKDALTGSSVVVLESNHDEKMLMEGRYPYPLKQRIRSKFGHLSNVDCAQTVKELAETGTKHFFLAHLSQENNRPEIALEETLNRLNDSKAQVHVLPVGNLEAITID